MPMMYIYSNWTLLNTHASEYGLRLAPKPHDISNLEDERLNILLKNRFRSLESRDVVSVSVGGSHCVISSIIYKHD